MSLVSSACAKPSASSLDSKARTVFWSSMVTMTAYAIAPAASFRCAIFMLKDIRSHVLSAKHATDTESEGPSSSPLKIQTRHHPLPDQLMLDEGPCDEAVMAVNSRRSR